MTMDFQLKRMYGLEKSHKIVWKMCGVYEEIAQGLCRISLTCRDMNAWVSECETPWKLLAAAAHSFSPHRSLRSTEENYWVIKPRCTNLCDFWNASAGEYTGGITHKEAGLTDFPFPPSCNCPISSLGKTKRERVLHWKLTVIAAFNPLLEEDHYCKIHAAVFGPFSKVYIKTLKNYYYKEENGDLKSIMSLLPKRARENPEDSLLHVKNAVVKKDALEVYRELLRMCLFHRERAGPWKAELKKLSHVH